MLKLAFLTLMLVPAAAGAHGLTTGFFDPFDDSARFDDAVASNAGAARISASWPSIAPKRPKSPNNPDDPAYNWDALDAVVADAKTHGLQVLLSIDQAPAWAQEGKPPKRFRNGSYRPRVSDVGAFATAVARRYAPSVKYVQLFNEPNLALYLSPQWIRTGPHSFKPFAAVRYRQMLNAAYPGVHAAGMKLVTAGTAPYGDPPGGVRTHPLTFWQIVMRKKVHFDVLAHHPYAVRGPRTHAYAKNDISLPDVHRLVALTRRAVARGRVLPRARKAFWVTELSWDSKPPDPQGVPMNTLARWVAESFDILWRQGVDHVFWFQVRDQAPDPSYQATNQSGMFFLNGKAKKAEKAFRFPLSCNGSQLWVKAPHPGDITIETTAGDHLKTLHPGADRVATAVLPGSGAVRAVNGGDTSLPCVRKP